jgi:hypothetical protein
LAERVRRDGHAGGTHEGVEPVTLEHGRRRANFCFYAAILCMPPILWICTAAVTPAYLAYFGSPDGWMDIGLAALAIGVILGIGVCYAVVKGYWREKSAALPIRVGVLTGIVGGFVPTSMLALPWDDQRVILIGLVPLAVLGGLLPWWLFRTGQRALWASIDDELIDSGDRVVVRARGARRLTLTVDGHFVAMKRTGTNDFLLLEDLTDVESVTATKLMNEERRDLTGSGDEIAVSPGAALRLRFTRGAWFFPADNAADVVRLIARRRDRALSVRGGDEADELVEDDEELMWHARRDRKITLKVDEDTVTMECDRGGETFLVCSDLDEVQSVEVTTISADQRRDVTGEDDEVLVTAGEALRITVEDGEWLFPIDKAGEIATLITARVARYRLVEQEFQWQAHGDHAITLSIDDTTVELAGADEGAPFHAIKGLDELASVTVVGIAEQTCDLTGEGDMVPVSAGEAVKFRFDDDSEWLFPGDDAQEIATLITSRAEHYRRSLEDDEPGTA